MHIYSFNVFPLESDTLGTINWLKNCYRYLRNSGIDEILLLRKKNSVEVFAVGQRLDAITDAVKNGLSGNMSNSALKIQNLHKDQEALRHFLEDLISLKGEIPADPLILSGIKEEFNIALDEDSIGPILTKMYRQGEEFGNHLQNDPVITKNCIVFPEVLLDIACKISGKLDNYQFVFVGDQISDLEEIILSVKQREFKKLYIYHKNFNKAYQLAFKLGCIPINLKQLQNQLAQHLIVIDLQSKENNLLNIINPMVKKYKEIVYIYFCIARGLSKNMETISPNLFIQSGSQIKSLIETHTINRKDYLQSIEDLTESEITTFYDWFYSDDRFVFDGIVSANRRMQKVFELMRRIAPSHISILISGETGTGKELIARAIHKNSARSDGNFIAVNCSAIPDTLLESELFGYEKGAFTGALTSKKGLIELASGGTLFLDEIGELPPNIQVKLLRVLQEREIQRIGNTEPLKVDIRLVTATNHNLEQLMLQGKFRSDLYYRVNTVQIHLPSLKERSEDIPILVKYFIRRLSRDTGKNIRKISEDVHDRFMEYDWPGNIRELENIIERAFAVSIGEEITFTDLPTRLQTFSSKRVGSPMVLEDSGGSLKQLEEERIRHLLVEKNVSLGDAARILGIGRTTLWRKMKSLGISREVTGSKFEA
jgi:transcriptional regulator with PAS, ATPase and Fis domain